MHRRYPFTIGVAVTLAVIIVGCASTKLREQWRDSDYQAAAGQRVLVIGVMGREERRRVFEDQVVAHLRKGGVDATPSYPQLSVSGPENLEAVKKVVEQSGATMVLSMRLVDMQQQTAVNPGYSRSVGFYGYYPHATVGVYSPPTSYTYQTYTTETRAFDMKSDKMVWAAIMQTEEPSDFRAAAAQYADLVVDNMRHNKIIVQR